jgi:hypothetical protein
MRCTKASVVLLAVLSEDLATSTVAFSSVEAVIFASEEL